MKRGILFSIIAMIGLASCQQKEDFTLPVDGEKMTFYASIADDATKTIAEVEGEKTKVLWAEGDAYAMSVKDGAFAKFSLEGEGGQTTGTFTGTATAGDGTQNVAYYPYAEGVTMVDGKLNVVIPAEQDYTPGSIAAAPMVAVSADNTLKFQNVASLIKITLQGDETIKSVSLTGNNDEILAGNALVTLEETPSLALAADAEGKTITLDCGEGIQLTADGVDFYFAVPSITLTKGFTVVATDSEEKAMIKSTTNEVVLTASKVKVFPAFEYAESTTSVSSKASLLSAIEKGGTIVLDADIELPANTVISSGVIIDGAGHIISTDEPAGTSGKGKGVFTLSGGTIKNVNFESPNTQYDIIVAGGDSRIENCIFATASAVQTGNGDQTYGKRAIFTGSAAVSGDLTVVDCTFDDKVYAFNFSNSTNTMDITFENCEMKGWLSGHGNSHKFVNCEFGQSGDYKNYIPYCGASFEGCTFTEGFTISVKHASTLKFDTDCKVGTTPLTTPDQLSWDNSGDGNDNGVSETLTIGSITWTNNGTTESDIDWEDNGLLEFLSGNQTGTYTLTGNVTVPANTVISSGVIIDGAGHTISTDEPAGTSGKGKGVFTLSGGTIKNVNFESPNTQYDIIVAGGDSRIENCIFATASAVQTGNGDQTYGKRAIFTGSAAVSGDLTVVDCTFDDKVYAFNFSNSTNTMDITFENCEMKGWLSGHGNSHKFVNCEFGQSGDYKNYIPYCGASFEGCTFTEGFTISVKHASTLKFDTDCKVGTTPLTTPDQLSWDNSGDGNDNGVSETLTIGSTTWTNNGTTKSDIEWTK